MLSATSCLITIGGNRDGSDDNAVHVYDLPQRTLLHKFVVDGSSGVQCVRLLSCQSPVRVLAGGSDGHMVLWNMHTKSIELQETFASGINCAEPLGLRGYEGVGKEDTIMPEAVLVGIGDPTTTTFDADVTGLWLLDGHGARLELAVDDVDLEDGSELDPGWGVGAAVTALHSITPSIPKSGTHQAVIAWHNGVMALVNINVGTGGHVRVPGTAENVCKAQAGAATSETRQVPTVETLWMAQRHDGPVVCLSSVAADGRMVSAGRDGCIMLWEAVIDTSMGDVGNMDSGCGHVCAYEPKWTWGGSRYYISTARLTRSFFYCDGRDNVVLLAKFTGASRKSDNTNAEEDGNDASASDGNSGGSDESGSDCD